MNEDKKITINIPCKVADLIGTLVSHNELIALWSTEDPWGDDEHHSYLEWRGMAHKLPETFKCREVIRIFGAIPENIHEADYINILIKIIKD